MELQRYDPSQSYRWNYDHAPRKLPSSQVLAVIGQHTFCGRPTPSPLGVAAGPLLNGRWILHYASLGFDILTYKTVRSRPRECYAPPNLVPVDTPPLAQPNNDLLAIAQMHGSWAVSFGMPSMQPDVWRADIEWTRSRLAPEKCLSVSVVASPEPTWTLAELALDFARCAHWAVESGADVIELNFSCPNVASADGQLYQQPAAAGIVAATVRSAIGSVPLLVKIGHLSDPDAAAQLLTAVAPSVTGLSMTNCISATVRSSDGQLFAGQPRGIAGQAIRAASVSQVRLFARLVQQLHLPTRLIGVGGIFTADDVREYLAAGAESVQLATALMLDPNVALQIHHDLLFAEGRPKS